MTTNAELADELREHLNTIAHAKVINGQDPTDTTWARYETAKCEAADWLRGRSDELQAALHRPEPAVDALTALKAVMGLHSVQILFEAAEEYPHAEEDVAAELSALKLARAALSALPRPEADEVICQSCGGYGGDEIANDPVCVQVACGDCGGTGRVLPRPEADEGGGTPLRRDGRRGDVSQGRRAVDLHQGG